MLTARLAQRGLLLGGLLFASSAAAEDAVRTPVRLTAGASDEYMGVLSPDGEALYFVSDVRATAELYVQRPVASAPRRVFESHGDVAWPQIGPGGRIAYVSFVRDATGDACLLSQDGGEGPCLTGIETSELQVGWLPKSARLAVLRRSGLHGDFRIDVFDRSGGSAETLLERNAVGIAVDPQERWLAYIPLSRSQERVGVTFANRVGAGAELVRLADEKRVRLDPGLPGRTGYLAFGPGGTHLYFSQYLNDTNRDGQIDGDDHSVLFRIPFEGDADNPVAGARPEQLTSARWDCHYPAPTKDRLIMTCSHEGSLDIHALPLEGAVPGGWDVARVQGEIEVARDLWTRLLLLGRRLAQVPPTSAAYVETLRQMVFHHLKLREHESAAFYARQLAEATPAAEPEERARARLLGLFAEHRQSDVRLARGSLSRAYILAARKRREAVAPRLEAEDPDLRGLAQLLTAEIESDVGDKAAALERFRSVDIEALTSPVPLHLAAELGARLYGWLGDRDAQVELLAKVAAHPALGVHERLAFSAQLVDELERGRPRQARAARIAEWRARVAETSDLGFLLAVETALLDIGARDEEAIREELFSLYTEEQNPERRRALVLRTVQAAAERGNEFLQYQFATTWASGLRRENPERKYAAELYRTLVLERAYGELADQEVSEARGYFFRASRNLTAFEAHSGFIEVALVEGEFEPRAFYAKRFARTPNDPEYLFVKAYLDARELPERPCGDDFDSTVDDITRWLEAASEAAPNQAEIHHLWGYALHQRARCRGDRRDAVDASRNYRLALDLARDDPRTQAAVLRALARLEASLGNHRSALERLEARSRLPYLDPAGRLSATLAEARSRFFTGDTEGAIRRARDARAAVEETPALARFRPLVEDRLALYLSAAGAPEAAEPYARLLELYAENPDLGTPLNLVKAHLGLAAARLAEKPEAALEHVDAALAVLEAAPEIEARSGRAGRPSLLAAYRFGAEQYRILAAGLEALSHRRRGDAAAAAEALRRRLALVSARHARTRADEDLLERARLHQQLAALAWEAEDAERALDRVEAGSALADVYLESTGTEVNEVSLALLRARAEIALYGPAALRARAEDGLAAALDRAYTFITAYPSPKWEAERFVLHLYLTLFQVGAPDGAPLARKTP